MERITNHTPLPISAAIAALLGLALLGGCQKRYTDYSAFVQEPEPVVASEEYRMAPPDVIEISSKRVREIHRHVETIRPDGKITLPLLGSVYVAGMTPEEASALLEELSQEYYEDADVTLRVRDYRSKKIFVFGEVSTPGPYPYSGRNSVLRTLSIAQPTRIADTQKIQVLRPASDGELVRRMTISLDKMVQEGDIALNALLEEGDIIYVPPTALGSVGLTFQQLLFPITPAVSTMQSPTDMQDAFQSRPYPGGTE